MPAIYHITRPSGNTCEGEVDLADIGDIEAALLNFACALLHGAIDGDSDDRALSSFTFERMNGKINSVVYGQGYLERRGNTLHHLRYRMLDSSGAVVARGMGTKHLKG